MNAGLLKKAIDMKEDLTKLRRHMHQHPELPFEEFATTALIKKELEGLGVQILPIEVKTGVVGLIKGEKPGTAVTALRADIDALPIVEQTSLPHASRRKGVMHACGHDGHTAALLGAARLLSGLKSEFGGVVKLIFQQAEESLEGARVMIQAGVLKNPDVDAIIALHSFSAIDVGKIGVYPGAYMASADRFAVKINGEGGHGAYPHKSVDAVVAAAHVVTALQSIVSREIDALDSGVLSVCSIAGGEAFNTLPYKVTLRGTVRCHSESVSDSIRIKMERTIRGITSAYRCGYALEYENLVPVLENDTAVTALVARAARRVLGENCLTTIVRPAMSSEDFALYLKEVRSGCFFRLGLHVPGEEEKKLHTNIFDFNDDALPIGAAVLTRIALMRNG
jgi:amidohydrolase